MFLENSQYAVWCTPQLVFTYLHLSLLVQTDGHGGLIGRVHAPHVEGREFESRLSRTEDLTKWILAAT